MHRKPWPIIFITIIFCLIPFMNLYISYYSSKSDLSFSAYIDHLLNYSENYFSLFTMIFPGSIAAYAIYSVRKWSYPVFLVCIAWITVQVFRDFTVNMALSAILLKIGLPILINFVCVSYFLLPEVRATYYDPRLRWWETKPRYLFSTDLVITLGKNELKGKTTNISDGGMFAILPQPIETGSVVEIKFVLLQIDFKLNGKVVYASADGISHGIQFVDLMAFQQRELADAMRILARANYRESRPMPVWTEDLIVWLKKLFTTGEGIVPKISKKD
jgi:hypothetical protein